MKIHFNFNDRLLRTIKTAVGIVGVTLLSACDRREPVAPPPPPVEQTKPADTVFDFIAAGDAVAFDAWLTNNPSINIRGDNQFTPLMHASLFGRTVFVRQLLEHGADFSMTDLQGTTALHAAARNGRSEILRLLLDAGADPNKTDYDGLSAYDIALMMGHASSAELIAAARAARTSTNEQATGESDSEIPQAILLSTDFRHWTSAAGDKVEAAFIQSVFDTLILQKRDGSMVRISINRLSAADQVIARQLSGIDPHALARVRTTRRTSAPKSDSMAERIGNKSGWTALEGCRLMKHSGNDGDSFHVMHEGKEYIFRLYFVDAAETNKDFPDRIRDQSRYFGLDESQTLKLGREAGKYSSSVLAGSSFNVYTKWEDARGNSSLPRFYALVSTPLGDLDELLTQEGLVRLFGMPISGGDGDRKHSRLRKLEQEAKQNKAGAWSKQDDVARE